MSPSQRQPSLFSSHLFLYLFQQLALLIPSFTFPSSVFSPIRRRDLDTLINLSSLCNCFQRRHFTAAPLSSSSSSTFVHCHRPNSHSASIRKRVRVGERERGSDQRNCSKSISHSFLTQRVPPHGVVPLLWSVVVYSFLYNFSEQPCPNCIFDLCINTEHLF